MPRFDVVSTPNPDSLKFTADGFTFVEGGMISASRPEEADSHSLAARICAVSGVANVFVLPQFMTVTKHREASWDDILPKIEALLEESF